MLQYSDAARELLPRFYAPYNDINVFVEDEDDEIFYEKLLQRLLSDSLRIKRVFGVGGKQNLFNKAKEHSSHPVAENAFFIADGDFDRILGISPPINDRLHVLDEYCIENFLFEEYAICLVVQEEKPSKNLEQWKAILNVAIWLEETVNVLTPLFECFIFLQKYDTGKPNIRVGVGEFISNSKCPSLDSSKVNEYIARLQEEFQTHYDVNFREEIPKVEQKMGDTWQDKKRNICGKKYLFPLLIFEIKRHCKRNLNVDSLRFRLVKHCHLDSLSSLRRQIEQVCCSS